jgi:hypothetical protein
MEMISHHGDGMDFPATPGCRLPDLRRHSFGLFNREVKWLAFEKASSRLPQHGDVRIVRSAGLIVADARSRWIFDGADKTALVAG